MSNVQRAVANPSGLKPSGSSYDFGLIADFTAMEPSLSLMLGSVGGVGGRYDCCGHF